MHSLYNTSNLFARSFMFAHVKFATDSTMNNSRWKLSEFWLANLPYTATWSTGGSSFAPGLTEGSNPAPVPPLQHVEIEGCFEASDVTKLAKIRIRRMRISTFKIRRMRIRMSLNKRLFY